MAALELRPESGALSRASQVYDPATGMLYALLPTASYPLNVPHVLEAIDVHTGATRVSVHSGAVLARTVLPAGLGLSAMAASSDGAYLYVSAAHEVAGGGFEGAVVLEYAAATGELLATADRSPVSYSVAGAELTGVPRGVWVSFRTGMLGLSVLLSSRRLAVIAAPAPDSPATGIYHWAMFSRSVYGGGRPWAGRWPA